MATITHWNTPRQLTGNVFVYGRVGAGKTCKLMTVAQGLHSKNWKIWDIFGGKREEGPFWCFPSDDHHLWNQIENETFEFKNKGPKQYKVKLLYPMFMSKLPKKLPYNPPNVIPKIFTIPFRDIPNDMEQLVSTVVGPLGTQSSRLWQRVIDKTDKKSNPEDLKYLFNETLKKSKSDKLYDVFFRPLIKEGLLSSEVSSYNIDFVEEAKDTETITVLCLDFVPTKYRYFVMGYILKKLFSLVKNNQIHKRNFAIFREASLFMKVVDADKSVEETTSIFRNIVTDIARYCRSGLFLGLDSQDSSEVRGMIEGSDDLLLICEMPSAKSREVTCEPLKKDKRISEFIIAYLGWKIQIHEVVIVERGKKAKILKRINPPRCRYWKSQYGDFYSLWRKEVNLYDTTASLLSNYKKELEDRKDLLLVRKIAKEKDKEKEKIDEIKEEVKIKETPKEIIKEQYINQEDLEEDDSKDRFRR